MSFGPCGGASERFGCEVDGRVCPFVGSPVRWSGPLCLPAALLLPEVIVDVRLPRWFRGDAPSLWDSFAASLDGSAALLGEHADNEAVDNEAVAPDTGRADASNAIGRLAGSDVRTLVTITGRGRTLSTAVGAADAAIAAGAVAIHCVTGDHPRGVSASGPDWFGTESLLMVSTLAGRGVPTTVAESPASDGRRTERLLDKQIAGAAACILNHSGDSEDLIDFAQRARDDGVVLPLFAPIPFVADAQTAESLENFPGLRLPSGYTEHIRSASDPEHVGLRLAMEMAATLSASGLFAGCNLSGGSRHESPARRVELTREFAAGVGSVWRRLSAC